MPHLNHTHKLYNFGVMNLNFVMPGSPYPELSRATE
ncbi:hypothetical protein E2C01_092523 [Portunus trituberculatus]|uniref:Uncharacterized protein n=1 Tax=Portunus trituberculatus TaxID=210409 RepID=A0A5B7JKG9_PORTR|nr:hypothetical protein [Portunus trituberculatus]